MNLRASNVRYVVHHADPEKLFGVSG